MKISLVCSSGGHFLELYFLKELWEKYDHFWITFPERDTSSILHNEKKYWAYYPTNRNLRNFIRNLFFSIKILKKERPDIIISTGAGVCVPFIYIAKLFKIKTVYIELLTRVDSLSLSGKLVYPVVDCFLVQWPELVNKYKKAKFEGQNI